MAEAKIDISHQEFARPWFDIPVNEMRKLI